MREINLTPVIIEGRIRNKKLILPYVYKVLKELGIHRFRRKCIIIQFVTECDSGAAGYTLDHCEDITYVEIARGVDGVKNGFLFMMKTLAHELVHVKQYWRKELCGDGGWTWKGKNAKNYSYENQPWEKEAYGREDELFNKCFDFDAEFTN